MLNNKKAQVGESITWIVATIILIIFLIIFVYASIVISKTKSIESNSETNLDEGDWINKKTEIAYSINDKDKIKIQNWILEGEEFHE